MQINHEAAGGGTLETLSHHLQPLLMKSTEEEAPSLMVGPISANARIE
jgi:hypothetical protein